MSGAQAKRSSTKLISLCATLVVAAATAALVISQTGVTGAEKSDSTEFTVAGDGTLPTKRPDLGESREPLSTKETGYAIHLASTDDSIPADATDVRGEAGPQFLYAELPTDIDSTGRKAVIVLYDYTGDRTYQQAVNLKSGEVSSTSAERLQPPPSPDEATAAITIAINTAPAPQFTRQFERSEGVPLVSADQVAYVAGAWRYDGTTTGGKECGADRCAQLIVKTTSGAYLDTGDLVVNLSTGRIVTLAAKP